MKKEISPPRPQRAQLGGVEFEFIGGDPLLDFHNTVAWPQGHKSNERLRRPVDLIRWAEEAGVITRREAGTLGVFARRNYSRARAILDDAFRLRDALHHLLLSVANETRPEARTLEELNRRQIKAMASVSMEWHDGRLQWAPRADPRMTTILDRVAWKAGELLTSDDVKRLRRCTNPDCGWLFLDRSRNSTRRWCSMRECGDRAKSKRYYQKKAQLVSRVKHPWSQHESRPLVAGPVDSRAIGRHDPRTRH